MIPSHLKAQKNDAAPATEDVELLPTRQGMPAFTFLGRYRLFPAVGADLPLAHEWLRLDPDHIVSTRADFWIAQSATVNSFLLYDDEGPVFFIRLDQAQKEIAIHVQFQPIENKQVKLRTMNAMILGLGWLQKRLTSYGYKALYFHSSNPELIDFCQKRLSFHWDGRRLVKQLRGECDGKTDNEATQGAA